MNCFRIPDLSKVSLGGELVSILACLRIVFETISMGTPYLYFKYIVTSSIYRSLNRIGYGLNPILRLGIFPVLLFIFPWIGFPFNSARIIPFGRIFFRSTLMIVFSLSFSLSNRNSRFPI